MFQQIHEESIVHLFCFSQVTHVQGSTGSLNQPNQGPTLIAPAVGIMSTKCSFQIVENLFLWTMVVLEAPIFDGQPDPWTLINWLDEMDQFFDQICLPDANKVRFARLKLRSRARDFWHSIENHRKGRSKPAITDWNEMKQILREEYVPQCYQENYQAQYSHGNFLHHRDNIQQENTSSFHQELTAIS